MSNTYQKTSRRAGAAPRDAEITVPDQVLVSMAEIAGVWPNRRPVDAATWHQSGVFADVPPSVADAAAEAVLCMQAGALRGAILLARAVIEATAKDKGVTDGSLSQKIDQLHERGYIRTYLRDGEYQGAA